MQYTIIFFMGYFFSIDLIKHEKVLQTFYSNASLNFERGYLNFAVLIFLLISLLESHLK